MKSLFKKLASKVYQQNQKKKPVPKRAVIFYRERFINSTIRGIFEEKNLKLTDKELHAIYQKVVDELNKRSAKTIGQVLSITKTITEGKINAI